MVLIAAGVGVVLVAGAATAAVAGLRGIADRVMLQPDDLGGAPTGPVEPGLAHPLLPQPCVDARVPQPVLSRSLAADYDNGRRHRVYENVARYRPGGAQAYLAALKEQLVRCRAGGDEEGFDPVAVDHLGPDTVLFLGTYDEGDRWVAYVAAAVGRYVVVVMVADPVVGGGDPTVANDIAAAADPPGGRRQGLTVSSEGGGRRGGPPPGRRGGGRPPGRRGLGASPSGDVPSRNAPAPMPARQTANSVRSSLECGMSSCSSSAPRSTAVIGLAVRSAG